MTRSYKSLFILTLVCLLVSGMAFAETYNLTILHTNDHHGHFMKYDPFPVSDVGGLAAQSTLVNVVRAEVEGDGGHVLLLSAGDVNTGIPESDMLQAEPDIKMMNMIGYDAMALGNHEFDKSVDQVMKQQEWAEFPFLAANVVKKATGETLVEPYIIKEFDGLKVAIFGLLTVRMPTLVNPDNVKDLEFKDVIETAKELVPKLKKEADLVVALTHIGLYDEDSDYIGDLQLAKAVPEIDVIVGGHSHTKLTEPKVVGNTLIVQAGAYSDYVGRLDLTVDSDANNVAEYAYKLVPVNMKKRVSYNDNNYLMYVDQGYVEDGAVLEAVTPYLENADTLLSQPIGEAVVELQGGRSDVRSRETNLGNLIADGMLDKTGAEIAMQNGGGIRANIAPGKVTYRDILTVQPFGNTLTVLDMTGAQVVEALNTAAGKVGGGGFMQVAGVKFTIKGGKAEDVMVGGAPIDLNKTYKVVTNNFIAAGGDGYDVFKGIASYDTGFVDADAFMEYAKKLGKLEPKVEGRITVVE